MLKVFDARLRPPYKSVKDVSFFSPEHTIPFSERFGGVFPPSAREKSMSLLMEEMQETGIVKALMPFNNRGKGMNNDDFTSLNQEYPDTFYGFVGLDPVGRGVQDCLDTIDKYVLNGDFTGANLEPGFDKVPWRLDTEEYFPIYEKCQENNIPMYITFGSLMADMWPYNPNYLDHVLSTFPRLKVMLGHGGFPNIIPVLAIACNYRNLYLNPDLYMVNCFGSRDFVDAANYRLKDQICFGSAYPYATLKDMVNVFLNSGIRAEVIENVMYNNTYEFVNGEPKPNSLMKNYA